MVKNHLKRLNMPKSWQIKRKIIRWVTRPSPGAHNLDFGISLNTLLKEGWIMVWRKRNHTTQKYNIYKTSFKCKQLINKIYKIMLGEEDIPTSERRNVIMKGETYTNKVLKVSIDNVNKDKYR